MFNRFTQDARWVAHDAPQIARELGDSSVEAEHLLLAIARRDDAAARVLHAAGLDEDAIVSALVAETERSLAAVGVSADVPDVQPVRGDAAVRALGQVGARALAADRARARRPADRHGARGAGDPAAPSAAPCRARSRSPGSIAKRWLLKSVGRG